jgi:hypothetical protein
MDSVVWSRGSEPIYTLCSCLAFCKLHGRRILPDDKVRYSYACRSCQCSHESWSIVPFRFRSSSKKDHTSECEVLPIEKKPTQSADKAWHLCQVFVTGASCLPRDTGRDFRESITGCLHGPDPGKSPDGPSSMIFLHRIIRASRLEGAKGIRFKDSTLAMARALPSFLPKQIRGTVLQLKTGTPGLHVTIK